MTPPPKKQAKATKDPNDPVPVLFKGEGPRVLHDTYRFTPDETTLVPRALADKLADEDPALYEVA